MAGGVFVDANVLLDILTADPQWLAWSSGELRGQRLADRFW